MKNFIILIILMLLVGCNSKENPSIEESEKSTSENTPLIRGEFDFEEVYIELDEITISVIPVINEDRSHQIELKYFVQYTGAVPTHYEGTPHVVIYIKNENGESPDGIEYAYEAYALSVDVEPKEKFIEGVYSMDLIPLGEYEVDIFVGWMSLDGEYIEGYNYEQLIDEKKVREDYKESLHDLYRSYVYISDAPIKVY